MFFTKIPLDLKLKKISDQFAPTGPWIPVESIKVHELQ